MKILLTLSFALISSIALGQGFSVISYEFSLLKSGVSKVYKNQTNRFEIWHIDSVNLRITKYTIKPIGKYNSIYPKYNDKYEATSIDYFQFNNEGHIDSIFKVSFSILGDIYNPKVIDTVFDTTVINYNYELFETTPINRKKFSIKNGQKILLRSDVFGYDNLNRLILIMEDEGRIQYFFKYNPMGLIEQETINKTFEVQYEYDESGLLVQRISSNVIVTYSYNEWNLISEVIQTGRNAQTTTYRYDF